MLGRAVGEDKLWQDPSLTPKTYCCSYTTIPKAREESLSKLAKRTNK